MCGGGGGGDGGAAERRDAEDARQAAAIARLNTTFGTGDEREGLYSKFASDARALQLDDLGKEKDLAKREVNFDLARRGLTGGSRQIDTDRDIGDQFTRGLLTAENNAQDVANNARMNDEKTRVSLVNSIRSGMGESDAISAALNGLQNNANQAAVDAQGRQIGGFFDSIRTAANQQQQNQAYEQAYNKYRTGGGSSTGGDNGTVRNTG